MLRIASVPDLYLRYESVLRPLLRVAPVVGGLALLVWRSGKPGCQSPSRLFSFRRSP